MKSNIVVHSHNTHLAFCGFGVNPRGRKPIYKLIQIWNLFRVKK